MVYFTILPKQCFLNFVAKVIEIGKCLLKLQLKMSGVFFETQCSSFRSTGKSEASKLLTLQRHFD